MVRPLAWNTASSPAVDVAAEAQRDAPDAGVGHLADATVRFQIRS